MQMNSKEAKKAAAAAAAAAYVVRTAVSSSALHSAPRRSGRGIPRLRTKN